MLLVEEKRPRRLEDVVGQEEAIHQLTGYTKEPWKTPHMVLSGPPGCGKTSAIHAWANQVYGVERKKHSVRTINTSGERSVLSVIQKVHNACRYLHETKGTKGLVICDEADCLTSEAQEVMAYCIRRYENRWIFVFIMNQPSRMNRRLMEMCEHIPFNPLGCLKDVVKSLSSDFTITDDDIDKLIEMYDGDLRKILNAIQGSNFESSIYVSEWKYVDDTSVNRMFNKIHKLCNTITDDIHQNEITFEIALGFHRPGSSRPYQYAIKEFL